jgi:hypothetical protein
LFPAFLALGLSKARTSLSVTVRSRETKRIQYLQKNLRVNKCEHMRREASSVVDNSAADEADQEKAGLKSGFFYP